MNDGFLKAAALSPSLRVADCAYNTSQILSQLKDAAARGVRLAVFPEFCLTGYTCGDLFLQRTLQQGALDADEVDLNRGNGLAFAKDGKWGFAANDGTAVIAPEYDAAKSFSGGVAAVCKDGKWGFINGRGTQVIDYLLVEAGYFDANGKCPAKMDGNDTQVMLSWRVKRS